MRAALNGLYRLAAGLAASCLVAIATMVVAQVGCRLIDGGRAIVGLDPLGLLVPSLAEIAGFLLVGASFMALASTLRHATHIRVTILLQHLPPAIGRVLEVWVLAVAAALMGYFTWHAGQLALDSFVYNEVSYGIIPVPLWIPQAVMTLGLGIFTVSLADDLAAALTGRDPSYVAAESGRSIEGME